MRARGFGLIELLIVAGLLALILYWSIQRAAPANRDAEVRSHVMAVGGWINRVRDCAAAQVDFANCDAATIRSFAPVGWFNGLTIRAPIGGTIAITAVTYGGVPNGAAQFTHSTLPRAVCRDVVYSLQTYFSTVTVNAVTLKSGPAVTFNPGAADTRCNAATNTLTGVFIP